MFLVRMMLFLAVVAGLGVAALFAVDALVEPEQKETSVSLPSPNPTLPHANPVLPNPPLPKS